MPKLTSDKRKALKLAAQATTTEQTTADTTAITQAPAVAPEQIAGPSNVLELTAEQREAINGIAAKFSSGTITLPMRSKANAKQADRTRVARQYQPTLRDDATYKSLREIRGTDPFDAKFLDLAARYRLASQKRLAFVSNPGEPDVMRVIIPQAVTVTA